MPPIQVSIINRSTYLKNTPLDTIVQNLQTQVSRDFAPLWGIDATLTLTTKPAPSSWWLVLLDDSDQAGALGYHDLTSEGLPLAKVFVQTSLKYTPSWTITASHELLEMLVDPDVNLSVFVQDSATSGILYGYEACDACEDTQFAYKVGESLVSDFVTPAWFESFRKPKSAQFDFQSKITKPFQLLTGGYIGIFRVSSGQGWQQLSASGSVSSEAHPHRCNCYSLRGLPNSHRQLSNLA